MHSKVLITGHRGQLGEYLADICLANELTVHGVGRDGIVNNLLTGETVMPCSLFYKDQVFSLIESQQYLTIYNLAAASSVAMSWDQPLESFQVNTLPIINLLEAVRVTSKTTRLFQASSSEAYSLNQATKIGELSCFKPGSPYGISKSAASMFVDLYREKYEIEAINGILFANESPKRNENFVTMKIVKFLVDYSFNRTGVLEIGNIDIPRDFGFSGEYARLIYNIMQASQLKNVIIASGEKVTLRHFIERICDQLEIFLSWHGEDLDLIGVDDATGKAMIVTAEKFYRPKEVGIPSVETRVLAEHYKMDVTVKANELVKILVDAEKEKHDRF